MRLIATFSDRAQAHTFSQFLTKEQIQNQVEEVAKEGTVSFLLWIYEEDDVERAQAEYSQFIQEPSSAKFHHTSTATQQILQATRRLPQKLRQKEFEEEGAPILRRRTGQGLVTLLLILTSVFCFLWGGFQVIEQKVDSHTRPIIVVSPLYQTLLYDDPKPLQLYSRLTKEYSLEELQHPDELPPEGQALLNQALSTPYWEGLYNLVVTWIRTSSQSIPKTPLFEKIGEGQLWRLFSPVVLHGDIFHILFNVIWLIVLGNQVEKRLKRGRYLFFLLLAAAASNTAQYLMSGPLFFGLSGLVTALFGFIWTRQRLAPWEGYLLSRTTIYFIAIFILAMFAIQLVSFFLQITNQAALSAGIANTAHLVGVAIGAICGRLNLFAYREGL